MDVNEAPTFVDTSNPKGWTVNEDDGDDNTTATLVAETDSDRTATTYTAMDVDSIDTTEDTVTLTVEGPDKDAVGDEKAFTFTGDPGSPYALAIGDATQIDFETKREYSITIVATDSNAADTDRTSMSKSIDVKIEVNNLEEDGTVELSQVRLQQGVSATASLDDPDGDVSVLRWQWSARAVGGDGTCPVAGPPTDEDEAANAWIRIKGATSATYTPQASHAGMGPLGDDGFNTDAMCLQATATYIDAVANENDDGDPRTDDEETFIDERKDAGHSDGMRVEPKTRGNAAPTFDKEDANDDLVMEDGTAGNPFMRSVDENDKNATVGSPLNSADADGDDMIHTLGGADAASFTIDSDSGQISVKGELDYETKDMHMVEVTATDPSLAKGRAMVMITVIDKDDPAVPTLVTEPSVPDCSTAVGDAGGASLVADCEALLDSEDALGGSLNWDVETDIMEWDGVTVEDERVTKLRLRGMGLDGTIPADLADLDALVYLILDRNELTGEITGCAGRPVQPDGAVPLRQRPVR